MREMGRVALTVFWGRNELFCYSGASVSLAWALPEQWQARRAAQQRAMVAEPGPGRGRAPPFGRGVCAAREWPGPSEDGRLAGRWQRSHTLTETLAADLQRPRAESQVTIWE